MKNYRLFSLMAIVMLALAGGAASLVVTDNPTATPPTGVTAATAVSVSSSHAGACPQKCADGPCQPCTPEECAARCGVDLKTAQECQKTAQCQTGTKCGTMTDCKMASANAGRCGQGTGCARRSQ